MSSQSKTECRRCGLPVSAYALSETAIGEKTVGVCECCVAASITEGEGDLNTFEAFPIFSEPYPHRGHVYGGYKKQNPDG